MVGISRIERAKRIDRRIQMLAKRIIEENFAQKGIFKILGYRDIGVDTRMYELTFISGNKNKWYINLYINTRSNHYGYELIPKS